MEDFKQSEMAEVLEEKTKKGGEGRPTLTSSTRHKDINQGCPKQQGPIFCRKTSSCSKLIVTLFEANDWEQWSFSLGSHPDVVTTQQKWPDTRVWSEVLHPGEYAVRPRRLMKWPLNNRADPSSARVPHPCIINKCNTFCLHAHFQRYCTTS